MRWSEGPHSGLVWAFPLPKSNQATAKGRDNGA
jgi:hypothetical protein